MWFITLLVFIAILWLLWTINQNTGDSVSQQTAIHAELIKLNKNLETQNKPSISEPPAPVQKQISTDANEQKININTASIEELTALAGIGKTTAQKIIDARPYVQINELAEVSGVSQEILDKISMAIEC